MPKAHRGPVDPAPAPAVEGEALSSALKAQAAIALTEDGRRTQIRMADGSKHRINELRAKARKQKNVRKPS